MGLKFLDGLGFGKLGEIAGNTDAQKRGAVTGAALGATLGAAFGLVSGGPAGAALGAVSGALTGAFAGFMGQAVKGMFEKITKAFPA